MCEAPASRARRDAKAGPSFLIVTMWQGSGLQEGWRIPLQPPISVRSRAPRATRLSVRYERMTVETEARRVFLGGVIQLEGDESMLAFQPSSYQGEP